MDCNFISNIEDKNIDPLNLNHEPDDAYFLTRSQYRSNRDVSTILSYLMSKSHHYIEKQMWLKLK